MLKYLFALITLAGSLVLAQAQGPHVPRDLIEGRRAVQGDAITFCVHPKGLAADFNRAVATELAKALLSKAKFHNVTPDGVAQPLDYSFPLSESELLIYLTDFCQVFTGFNLVADHPDWLSFSRVYAQTDFVLAVTNPEWNGLEDLPLDKTIGARFISAADLKLVNYIQSLPENKRWGRTPLFNNKILIEKLLDGTVGAALIWEPALRAGLKGNPKAESVRVISMGNFKPPTINWGMAIRSKDTYLRTLLDQAIDSLVKDGTIERLMQQHGIPGRAGELQVAAPRSFPTAYLIAGAAAILLFAMRVMTSRKRRPVVR